jgi:hypothetical protein
MLVFDTALRAILIAANARLVTASGKEGVTLAWEIGALVRLTGAVTRDFVLSREDLEGLPVQRGGELDGVEKGVGIRGEGKEVSLNVANERGAFSVATQGSALGVTSEGGALGVASEGRGALIVPSEGGSLDVQSGGEQQGDDVVSNFGDRWEETAGTQDGGKISNGPELADEKVGTDCTVEEMQRKEGSCVLGCESIEGSSPTISDSKPNGRTKVDIEEGSLSGVLEVGERSPLANPQNGQNGAMREFPTDAQQRAESRSDPKEEGGFPSWASEGCIDRLEVGASEGSVKRFEAGAEYNGEKHSEGTDQLERRAAAKAKEHASVGKGSGGNGPTGTSSVGTFSARTGSVGTGSVETGSAGTYSGGTGSMGIGSAETGSIGMGLVGTLHSGGNALTVSFARVSRCGSFERAEDVLVSSSKPQAGTADTVRASPNDASSGDELSDSVPIKSKRKTKRKAAPSSKSALAGTGRFVGLKRRKELETLVKVLSMPSRGTRSVSTGLGGQGSEGSGPERPSEKRLKVDIRASFGLAWAASAERKRPLWERLSSSALPGAESERRGSVSLLTVKAETNGTRPSGGCFGPSAEIRLSQGFRVLGHVLGVLLALLWRVLAALERRAWDAAERLAWEPTGLLTAGRGLTWHTREDVEGRRRFRAPLEGNSEMRPQNTMRRNLRNCS